MALITPPNWLQAGTYTAQADRVNQQAVLNTSGVIGATSLAVTAQASPNMTVNIASGWAAIVSGTSNQGVYGVYNDATVVQSISAANASNPRIDLIVATVNDAAISGSLNNVVFTTVAGTPAASPTVPSTPANSIVIAQIAVAANTTTISTANITDRRVPVQNSLTNANYYFSPALYSIASPTTALQNILAATGSSLTLAAGATYEVEGILRVGYVNGATATLPTFQLTYSGTVASSQILFNTAYNTSGSFNTGAQTAVYSPSQTVNATINPAPTLSSVSGVVNTIAFKGFIKTTTGGTLTPQYGFSSVATVSAVQCLAGSTFKVTPVGGAGLTSVGAWS